MSSKNSNPCHRKRPRLNVYTPLNPSLSAPSTHKTYSFVSRSEGYQARSSRIISSEYLFSFYPLKPELESQPGMSYGVGTMANDDVVGNDYDTDLGEEVEANDRSIRKRTAGVSLPPHLLTKILLFH